MTQPESHYIFDGRFKLKSISLCLRRQIEALRWRFGRSNSLRVCRDKVFVAHTVIFWRRLSANMNAGRNFTSISLYKKQNVTVCKCRERRAQCVVGNVISAIFVRFPSHTVCSDADTWCNGEILQRKWPTWKAGVNTWLQSAPYVVLLQSTMDWISKKFLNALTLIFRCPEWFTVL